MNILLCWELGGGMGHLGRLGPLAQALREAGATVEIAVPDPAKALATLSTTQQLLQTPRVEARPSHAPISFSYADNLWRNGYGDVSAVTAALGRMLDLMRKVEPRALVAEHAPLALLAARVLGIPRVAVGTGFTVPPSLDPMPTIQPWFNVPAVLLQRREARLASALSDALRPFGGPTLTRCMDVFEGTTPLICTLAELDHYDRRPHARFCGPVVASTGIRPPCDTDVFVYMPASHPRLPDLLETVTRLGVRTLAVVRGLSEPLQARWQSPHLHLQDAPVNLRALRCRAAVTHGGSNAATLLLLSGVPLLLVPHETEQAMWAWRLQQRGLALATRFLTHAPDLEGKLRRLLDQGPLAAAVALTRDHGFRLDASLPPNLVTACLEAARQ